MDSTYESCQVLIFSGVLRLNINGTLSFWWQVISRVGDLVGIKYFPAAPNKQQQEKGMIKVDWRIWSLGRVRQESYGALDLIKPMVKYILCEVIVVVNPKKRWGSL